MTFVDSNAAKAPNDKVAGAMLAASSALSVLVMAHHPANSQAAFLANLVHGALMILFLIVLAGYIRFCVRQGLERPTILAGLVFYAAATLGTLVAAAVNGFVAPALAARETPVSRDIFTLIWELNQALAYNGVYAFSFAFVLWGVGLLSRKRPLAGLAGLVAGAAPAAMLASGALDMHVAGAFIIYGVQAAFGLIVGLLMMRGRL